MFFWSKHQPKVMSKTFYYTHVSHSIRKKDILTHKFYLDIPILVEPADCTRAPHTSLNVDDIAYFTVIHQKK